MFRNNLHFCILLYVTTFDSAATPPKFSAKLAFIESPSLGLIVFFFSAVNYTVNQK